MAEVRRDTARHRPCLAKIAANSAHDDHGVRDQEDQEDRRQDQDRFLDAAEVEQRQTAEYGEHGDQLVRVPRLRQKTEHGVARGRDRDGDREDVVDQQRGSGYQARVRSEVLRRDDVSTAALRELLDDPAVPVGDDEHRQRHGQREEQRHVAVTIPERLERLLGPVRRRRQTV